MSIDPLAVSGMRLRKLFSAKYPSFFSVLETAMAENVLKDFSSSESPVVFDTKLDLGGKCVCKENYTKVFPKYS